jgi:hypothetical protein
LGLGLFSCKCGQAGRVAPSRSAAIRGSSRHRHKARLFPKSLDIANKKSLFYFGTGLAATVRRGVSPGLLFVGGWRWHQSNETRSNLSRFTISSGIGCIVAGTASNWWTLQCAWAGSCCSLGSYSTNDCQRDGLVSAQIGDARQMARGAPILNGSCWTTGRRLRLASGSVKPCAFVVCRQAPKAAISNRSLNPVHAT